MIDSIGAEHIEGTLVVEGGADGAVAVQGDVVIGVGIHQQAQGGLWGAIDEEIDKDIRGDVDVIWYVGTARWLTRSCILGDRAPFDKLLIGDGIGRGSIIDKDGILLRRHVAVDGYLTWTAFDGDVARSKDGAVES